MRHLEQRAHLDRDEEEHDRRHPGLPRHVQHLVEQLERAAAQVVGEVEVGRQDLLGGAVPAVTAEEALAEEDVDHRVACGVQLPRQRVEGAENLRERVRLRVLAHDVHRLVDDRPLRMREDRVVVVLLEVVLHRLQLLLDLDPAGLGAQRGEDDDDDLDDERDHHEEDAEVHLVEEVEEVLVVGEDGIAEPLEHAELGQQVPGAWGGGEAESGAEERGAERARRAEAGAGLGAHDERHEAEDGELAEHRFDDLLHQRRHLVLGFLAHLLEENRDADQERADHHRRVHVLDGRRAVPSGAFAVRAAAVRVAAVRAAALRAAVLCVGGCRRGRLGRLLHHVRDGVLRRCSSLGRIGQDERDRGERHLSSRPKGATAERPQRGAQLRWRRGALDAGGGRVGRGRGSGVRCRRR